MMTDKIIFNYPDELKIGKKIDELPVETASVKLFCHQIITS
ncbi:MAG TPA: hypothetical protein VGI43_09450 [Mucilaginibacter sp.]|jgi:hypothetical protein